MLKKWVIVGMSLVTAFSLAACGHKTTHSSDKKVESSSKQVKKHKDVDKKTSEKKESSSSSSSSSKVSSKPAKDNLYSQLSQNDWFMLAYLHDFHLTFSNVLSTPELLRCYDNEEIDSGSAPSIATIKGATNTAITINYRVSFGHFKDSTLQKRDLLNKYIHSKDDLATLKNITNTALKNADIAEQQSAAERDSYDDE